MGDAKGKFIKPLMAILPPPKTDDLASFVTVYANALEEFPDEVLERAADGFIRTLDKKSMPLPAECIAACEKAKESIDLAKRRASRPPKPAAEEWDTTKADELMNSELGRRSVAEGWEIGLWDWLAKNKRMPDQHEAASIKANTFASKEKWRESIKKEKENGGLSLPMKVALKALRAKSDRIKSTSEGNYRDEIHA